MKYLIPIVCVFAAAVIAVMQPHAGWGWFLVIAAIAIGAQA